jgi:hypothetical protein
MFECGLGVHKNGRSSSLICVQVGTVKSVEDGADDKKTLKDIKFQTGDYMDVSIMAPKDREKDRDRDNVGPSRGRGSRTDRPAPRPWR